MPARTGVARTMLPVLSGHQVPNIEELQQLLSRDTIVAAFDVGPDHSVAVNEPLTDALVGLSDKTDQKELLAIANAITGREGIIIIAPSVEEDDDARVQALCEAMQEDGFSALQLKQAAAKHGVQFTTLAKFKQALAQAESGVEYHFTVTPQPSEAKSSPAASPSRLPSAAAVGFLGKRFQKKEAAEK